MKNLSAKKTRDGLYIYYPPFLAQWKRISKAKKRREGGIKPSTRYEVMMRDGFRCVLCGKTAEEERLEVDHIVPVARGGKHKKENLRTLCYTCNIGKSDKTKEGLNVPNA